MHSCLSFFQACVTFDLRFIDVFIGWPGHAQDDTAYRNNPLSTILSSLLRTGQPRLAATYHILGDKAYPLIKDLITPFKRLMRHGLTRRQRVFNRHLSSKRQVS